MMTVFSSVLFAAAWIAGAYVNPPEADEAAFFADRPNDLVMRRFAVRDVPVKKAVWRVCAPGMRDLFVNGERVSATALPPFTVYPARVLEEAFDVTSSLRRGAENELRVELGNGWWNLAPLRMWYRFHFRGDLLKCSQQGVPCVMATLDICYADGERERVETDSSWLAAEGQTLFNSLYMGVRVDSRREVRFSRPARVVEGPCGKVEPSKLPKTVVYDRWPAKTVTRAGEDKWLVDFGVNFAGTYRAQLRGVPAGCRVRFRSGERKFDDGSVNCRTAVAGQIKNPQRGPLFAVAEQCEEWIAAGAERALFEPRLTFHAFRYLQVEGLGYEPKPDDFEALAWSAQVAENGHFECSDARLNNLHAVCRRTFRANLQGGVQSDCPGREKLGYGGDMACTAESFLCNYAMHDIYVKAIRDFLDEAERANGYITETAPYVGLGIFGENVLVPEAEANGRLVAPIGWAVGLPVLVDLLVRYCGDLEIMREAYPTCVRYIALISARYPDDCLPDCLGDWISLEKAALPLTTLAHWHQFLALTAKFARLLDRPEDAARFRAHAERVAEKFRERFVKSGGLVGDGKQGEQLFALYHGLLTPDEVPAAYARLKADLAKHGNALTTGIFGTKYLYEVLSTGGDAELAGQVVTHEGCPGYYFMIERGATTLWEHWLEPPCLDVYSNCHPMFGSCEEWFVRHVLGIAVTADAIGCDKVRIRPNAVCGLTSASGWLNTPKGRISVAWRLVDGVMKVEKQLPDGIEEVP